MEENWKRDVKKKKKDSRLLKIITVSIRIPVFLIIALVIISFFGTGFFLSKYPNTLSFIGITLNPQLQVQNRNENIIKVVGELINLPADEKPTIATVTDVEVIRNQPFFANAQNGDVVLIYNNARKAILYRESENRIIEVGAVTINQQNQDEIPEEESDVEEEAEVEEDLVLTPTEKPEEIPTSTPTPEEEAEEAAE